MGRRACPPTPGLRPDSGGARRLAGAARRMDRVRPKCQFHSWRSGMSDDAAEPIEDYLDQLMGELRGTPRETRRLLGEAEDHLRETAERLKRQQGYDEPAAQWEAVRQFGSPAEVA